MIVKLLYTIAIIASISAYKLQKVIVLSRHNIRTPLFPDLESMTPKTWPPWSGDAGHLTAKGRLLERAMGKYFSDWMIQNKLFDNNCPKDVLVYANTRHRTKETAKAFAEGAFGDCVEVYYKNITEMDPVFNPVIRNKSETFKENIVNAMKTAINSLQLKDAYSELNRIVDFKGSSKCKDESLCDLSELKSEVVYEYNEEPNITGALWIGTGIVDSFLMAYYDGFPSENVAWGQIQTAEQWNTLISILKAYHKVRFETKDLDKDLASTLLEYISNIFEHGNKKFYILVGHDANILSLMSSLHFKDYTLHDQLENTPIGGKLVFQKWYDEENDQDLLRVSYVYQSTDQIRNGVEVSLQHPPEWQTLEMEDCALDINEFCLWNVFISNLKRVTDSLNLP